MSWGTFGGRRAPGVATVVVCIPGADFLLFKEGADGLTRLRCPVCSAYKVFDVATVDTTTPLYLDHKSNCPIGRHVADEQRWLIDHATALDIVADLNRHARAVAGAEAS